MAVALQPGPDGVGANRIPRMHRRGDPAGRSSASGGALGALRATAAEAQIRTPRRTMARSIPTAELRLLRRVTMGVTPEDRVVHLIPPATRRTLEWQLNPAVIGDPDCDARLAARTTLGLPAVTLYAVESGLPQKELAEAAVIRAVFSSRQLYERMVEFWSDHFNISLDKVGYLKVIDDREVIRVHALGNFLDLLKASSRSPAMLAYLDRTRAPPGGRTRTTRAN